MRKLKGTIFCCLMLVFLPGAGHSSALDLNVVWRYAEAGAENSAGRAILESDLKVLRVREEYYRREIRASWILTGFGLLLELNGLLVFSGADRNAFMVLGAGLSAAGTILLVNDYAEMNRIRCGISKTILKLNFQ